PTSHDYTTAPLRDVRMWSPEVNLTRAEGGVIYVRAVEPLGSYPARITDRLDYWAGHAPGRLFMAQRDAGGNWRTLTYEEARDAARRIAQALLDRNLGIDRPVAILSGNDLEHMQLSLAAMYAGIPYAPISPAYSLLSTDFGKLRYILNLLTPGLIFVCDTE